MQWIRRVSLVRRVVIGFSLMAVAMCVLGGSAAWHAARESAGVERVITAFAEAKVPVPKEIPEWRSAAAHTAKAFAALTAAGCALSAVCAFLIRASIKESVESTVMCVVRIAGGDLETKIESPGRDEISWLRGELNGMRKKLRTAVLEVRETVDSLNVASAEIASGNLDLSSRTESQAGALQETASSIDQLSSSVRSNAESTHEAKSVVEQSSQVAERGAKMMQDVIARMGEINVSASKISEIIGVIDGIAFQTNILALNAAVEAARAGEHGRGFAVVASEVRSLAQRSSSAAREIKTLIGDSTHKVNAGSKLVDDAGRTMQDIVDSVGRVAALIGSIDDAGQSQSSGIGQVSDAIAQIDTMTQQNAALVEQLAAAAQSLKGQSNRLTTSVAAFQVKG